jgi:hypothetical protein
MDKIKNLISSYETECKILSEYLEDLPRLEEFDTEKSVCKARLDEKRMFIEILKNI